MPVKQLTKCGLFAALTAICSWLAIPIGDIAVTMQTFIVFLGLFTLGGRGGSIAFFVYLCLGAVGAPVFSGFRGGIGAFADPTGGYLWGLMLSCLLFWLLEGRKLPKLIIAAFAMILCYLCGTAWYYFAYLSGSSLGILVLKCVVPYLIPDGIKIWLSYTISQKIKARI